MNNYEFLKDNIFNELRRTSKYFIFENVKSKMLETLNIKDSNNPNFIKLAKQISYDYLVDKRRSVKNEDLIVGKYKCKNPAHFPEINSVLDKLNHIDHLTSWTEDWIELKYENISFNYLKNLDSNILILCKDSTGQETYFEYSEPLRPYLPNVSSYINKKIEKNPYEKESSKKIINDWRFGFSPDVKNNKMIRSWVHKYLENERISESDYGNVEPISNENIFLTNSFVFLSASEISPSIVPETLFKKSIKEYIIPLLDIIKPKCVVQAGSDAIYYSKSVISDIVEEDKSFLNVNNIGNINCSMTELLKETHKKMKNNEEPSSFLFHLNWDTKKTTYFFPSTHPSRPLYFKLDNKMNDGHYVWKYLNNYIKKI